MLHFRRLLADYLVVVVGVAVEHLSPRGEAAVHPVTGGARRDGDRVVYHLTQDRLFDGE